MTLMEAGHVTIISLLLGIMHGVKVRFEVVKNGDGKRRVRYRVYFANNRE